MWPLHSQFLEAVPIAHAHIAALCFDYPMIAAFLLL
jgi:hypothetical protein